MFLEMEDDNVLAGIEYYGVYDVYANFTHAEDVPARCTPMWLR